MATYIVNAIDVVLLSDENKTVDVIHDGFNISDSVTANITQSVHIQDGIKINTKAKTVYSVFTSDNVSFSEHSRQIYPIRVYDTVRFLESPSIKAVFNMKLSDSIILSELSKDHTKFSNILFDNVVFQESPLYIHKFDVSDNVNITDTTEVNIFHLLRDSIEIADNAQATVIYRPVVHDGINFNEDHKWNNLAFASDRMWFSDYTKDVRVRVSCSDVASFIDKAQVFNRYYMSCSDGAMFVDDIIDIVTPYIKRIGDFFLMEDEAIQIAYYRIKIKEKLIFSDDTIARLIVHAEQADDVQLSDIAGSAVHFSDPLIPDSTLVITDSCKITVSRIDPWKFTNALVAGIGTTETTLYTCPEGIAEVINMSFCNVSSNTLTFSLSLYKTGTTEFHIIRDIPLDQGESFVINNVKDLITSIEKSDEIRVTSSISNSIDAYIAILEKKQG